MLDWIQEESPIYRKKKSSNISKSSVKADHKHRYTEVILKLNYNDRVHFHRSDVCEICGKIRNIRYFETRPADFGAGRIVKECGEILSEYKHLPIIEADGFSPDYINIDNLDN